MAWGCRASQPPANPSCAWAQRARQATAQASRFTACGAQASEGSRVRVTAPIRVYHSLKYRKGLDIQGLEGTVLTNVMHFKGKTLSATKPWKTALEAKDPAGAPMKLTVHLVSVEGLVGGDR